MMLFFEADSLKMINAWIFDLFGLLLSFRLPQLKQSNKENKLLCFKYTFRQSEFMY